MWTIVLRAAALLGIGAAVGSSVSNPSVIHSVPQPAYQEASSSVVPFMVISVALLVCAAGYFILSMKRSR